MAGLIQPRHPLLEPIKMTTIHTGILERIQQLKPAIASKPSHAVLTTVKLKKHGDSLTATVTDLTNFVQVDLLEGNDDFEVLLPYEVFAAWAKKIPSQDLTIDGNDGALFIHGAGIDYQFTGALSHDEFPVMPDAGKPISTAFFEAAPLIAALKVASAFTKKEGDGFPLEGVFISVAEDTATIQAANSFVAIAQSIQLRRSAIEPFSFLLKPSTVNLLTKLTSDSIQIKLDAKGTLSIVGGDLRAIAQQQEGKYPDLPEEEITEWLTVDRKALQKSLERIAPSAAKLKAIGQDSAESENVWLIPDVEKQTITLIGFSGSEEFPASVQEGSAILTNAPRLIGILKKIKTATVSLHQAAHLLSITTNDIDFLIANTPTFQPFPLERVNDAWVVTHDIDRVYAIASQLRRKND